MFRETATAAVNAHRDEDIWPVLNREPASPRAVETTVDEATAMPASCAFRSAVAAPDVPAAVGALLFTCYLALIGALARRGGDAALTAGRSVPTGAAAARCPVRCPLAMTQMPCTAAHSAADNAGARTAGRSAARSSAARSALAGWVLT